MCIKQSSHEASWPRTISSRQRQSSKPTLSHFQDLLSYNILYSSIFEKSFQNEKTMNFGASKLLSCVHFGDLQTRIPVNHFLCSTKRHNLLSL